jgi:hypothetical protein
VSKDIVINLLAFADAVAKGTRQANCFSEVASLGVKKVEVRREWIKDFINELPEMHSKDVPMGIEFPCGQQPRELLLKTIEQIQQTD